MDLSYGLTFAEYHNEEKSGQVCGSTKTESWVKLETCAPWRLKGDELLSNII